MEDFLARAIDHLFGRADGPMWMRLLIQPLVASFFALRDGMRDARDGRPPYGISLLIDPVRRVPRIRDGWRSIRKVFFAAVAIDVVYQIVELRWIYPGEALIVAQVVALVPYVLLRGPVNRLTRLVHR